MPFNSRAFSTVALALALTLLWVVGWYWQTAQGVAGIWWTSDTFAHGLVVFPAFAWLAYSAMDLEFAPAVSTTLNGRIHANGNIYAAPDGVSLVFAGDVTAGKYNDGAMSNRVALARRMADGMKRAWDTTKREPISADAVKWTVEPTENGLRVPHRQNIFCEWNTALLAYEFQKREEACATVELTA